jgi:uncharacterized cupredoxin-like copper-binding protein
VFGGVALLWLLLLVVAVVVGLLRPTRHGVGRGQAPRAEAILAKRLADGEIDQAEHDERAAALRSSRSLRAGLPSWVLVAVTVAIGVAMVVLATGTVSQMSPGGPWSPGGGAMHGVQGMHGMMMRPGTATDGQASAELPGAGRVVVEAGDMWFEPNSIEIEATSGVNLTIVNRGRVFHDLVIDELDFRLGVEPGQSATGGLVSDAPGRYEFYCSVPGHAAAGMRGTLTIQEAW